MGIKRRIRSRLCKKLAWLPNFSSQNKVTSAPSIFDVDGLLNYFLQRYMMFCNISARCSKEKQLDRVRLHEFLILLSHHNMLEIQKQKILNYSRRILAFLVEITKLSRNHFQIIIKIVTKFKG